MSRSFVARYPHTGTEKFFDDYLARLEPTRKQKVVKAILGLEDRPKPIGDFGLGYVDTGGGPREVLLRLFPGIPFVGGKGVLREILQARHHITVEDVTIVYALNEEERIVWLMGIRDA